jgi:hypothetical protein
MVVTGHAITKGLTHDKLVASIESAEFDRLRPQPTERLGPVWLGHEIERIKSVFAYAKAARIIKQGVEYGLRLSPGGRNSSAVMESITECPDSLINSVSFRNPWLAPCGSLIEDQQSCLERNEGNEFPTQTQGCNYSTGSPNAISWSESFPCDSFQAARIRLSSTCPALVLSHNEKARR